MNAHQRRSMGVLWLLTPTRLNPNMSACVAQALHEHLRVAGNMMRPRVGRERCPNREPRRSRSRKSPTAPPSELGSVQAGEQDWRDRSSLKEDRPERVMKGDGPDRLTSGLAVTLRLDSSRAQNSGRCQIPPVQTRQQYCHSFWPGMSLGHSCSRRCPPSDRYLSRSKGVGLMWMRGSRPLQEGGTP
jgi:hypothetical protein